MDSFICYKYIYIDNPISFIHSMFNLFNKNSLAAYCVQMGEDINMMKAGCTAGEVTVSWAGRHVDIREKEEVKLRVASPGDLVQIPLSLYSGARYMIFSLLVKIQLFLYW